MTPHPAVDTTNQAYLMVGTYRVVYHKSAIVVYETNPALRTTIFFRESKSQQLIDIPRGGDVFIANALAVDAVGLLQDRRFPWANGKIRSFCLEITVEDTDVKWMAGGCR